MPTKPVRLYDKIDTGVQNVPAGCSPKVAFIEIWQDIKADYEIMRKVVHQHLSCLLDENGIPATVASCTKTLESISKSIDRRDDAKPDGQKHQSPRQIFDDLHDLVGFRVVVDYPSGLERSYDLIKARFKTEKINNFPSTRAVGQYWKPRFGAYETRNYLVRLASDCSIELAIYADILFEIQVTTMAESLYNKLAHPLFYKASQGPLSRKDEMIIDMGHGAALLYWISVACMEERLENYEERTLQNSKFPYPVRYLAGHNGTSTNLDAVLDVTPEMPTVSKDSTSVDLLLKSLDDLRLSYVEGENIWEIIRKNLGLQDQHQPSFQLPTVPEARFDSKDLEESPKCHEKTRREVRNKILQWVDDVEAETLFWLHAPAGVGKSTLARTLVDDLRSQRKLAAGYFFKRGDEVRNDTCRVIPTIASQLIKTIPQYMNCLRQSIGSCNVETIDKISLQDQFDTLVYKPLSSTQCHLSNMLIIIDALDECTRPKDIPLILKLFSRLSALSNCRLCVLLSSRETRPLINAFKPFKDNNTCRDMALHEEFLISTRREIGTVLKDGLAAIKANRVVTEDPWPSFQVFDRVLKYATNPSPLYVYTSTFLRHIDGRNPAKRLERWLKSSRKSVSQLDHIYDPIINSVLAGEGDDDIPEPLEEDEILDLQLILGSLTLLAKPLQARFLQTLLSMDGDRFNTTLEALHAVVRATDDGHPLELIHKSFADYILGLENTSLGSFSIDTSQIHRVLSERCIDRMQQGLCKNFCHVDNPLIMSQDFNKNMVTKFIPPDLAYACVYWVYHIERSQNAFDLVNPFLEKHLLHWFEALSILGQRSLVEGGAAIRSLLTRGKRYPCTDNSNDSAIVKDAERFLKVHGPIFQKYPLQVYGSCLALSHPESRVKQLFAESRSTRLASIRGMRCGLTSPRSAYDRIEIYQPHAIAISLDSQKLAAFSRGEIKVLDVETSIVFNTLPLGKLAAEKPTFVVDWKSPILAISFTNDQVHIIALTQQGRVYAWDIRANQGPVALGSLETGNECFEHGDISGQFSVAVATRDTMLYVWNFQKGIHSVIKRSFEVEKSERFAGNRICDVSLHTKGHSEWIVAMINLRGVIFVWRGSKTAGIGLSCIGKHDHSFAAAPKIAISACSPVIASSLGNDIRLWKWDGVKGIHTHTISHETLFVRDSMAFLPNGKALAFGGPHLSVLQISGQFSHAHEDLRDDKTKKPSAGCQIVSSTLFEKPCNSHGQYTHISDPSTVVALKLASNKRVLLTASNTHPALVWDIETGVLLHQIPYLRSVKPDWHLFGWAISSSGSKLALGTICGSIDIFNLQTKTTAQWVCRLGFFRDISCMEFTSDTRSLAISADSSLSLWNAVTGERQWLRHDRSFLATSVKTLGDGDILVAFSCDEALLVDTSTTDCGTKVNWASCIPETIGVIQTVDITFSETDRSVLLYVSGSTGAFEVLTWSLASRNIGLMNFKRENVSCGVYLCWTGKFITVNYRGKARCLLTDLEKVTAAGDRVVIAQDDGQFTILDFHESRVNNI